MNAMKTLCSVVCALVMTISAHNVLAAAKAPAAAADSVAVEAAVSGKIDLNSASEEMLTQLPGIGPKTAERITAYRKANGPFKTVDDLLNIKGIGPKVLEKIRPMATVS